MGTRVLSLWLPHLAIDRIRHENRRSTPGQRWLPLATCLQDEENQPIVAVCARSEQAGLRPGMSRADAIRRISNLRVYPSDQSRDREFLERIASWCERYTAFVAIDQSFGPDRGGALWLDIGHSAHLSGGEAGLLARLLGRCRQDGLTAKAAIADHPGSAWAACRFGGEEQRILPANGARVSLAPWPMAALRLDKADCTMLESAGFDRIEHLYSLPRRSIVARFGDHVGTRLDQALGLVDEPIAVDTPRPAQQAQMIFADPIIDPETLPSLIEALLRQLCVGLEAAGLGLRRLTLALYRVDNSAVTCSIGTAHASRDIAHLSALIGHRFDEIDLGFGLERAILDAVEIEPVLSENIHWRGLGTAADHPLPDLALIPSSKDRELEFGCSRASYRSGRQDANRFRKKVSSLPPFLVARQNEMSSLPVVQSASSAALALPVPEIDQPAVQETSPRPLRLLRQPEPIEAIASLPGEPPVLFRWRQRLHKVVGAQGPETVAPDWWRIPDADRPSLSKNAGKDDDTDPAVRDYFAVEDDDGARFWLFRESRYDQASGTLPRWFLHGVFS